MPHIETPLATSALNEESSKAKPRRLSVFPLLVKAPQRTRAKTVVSPRSNSKTSSSLMPDRNKAYNEDYTQTGNLNSSESQICSTWSLPATMKLLDTTAKSMCILLRLPLVMKPLGLVGRCLVLLRTLSRLILLTGLLVSLSVSSINRKSLDNPNLNQQRAMHAKGAVEHNYRGSLFHSPRGH